MSPEALDYVKNHIIKKREPMEVLNPKDFILSGKAHFVLKNLNTRTFYKYKVTQSPNNEDYYFIRVYVNSDWSYAGFVVANNDGTFTYKQGIKGTLDSDASEIKGILYALKFSKPLPSPMIMSHIGKCGCCGYNLKSDKEVITGYCDACYANMYGRDDYFRRNDSDVCVTETNVDISTNNNIDTNDGFMDIDDEVIQQSLESLFGGDGT